MPLPPALLTAAAERYNLTATQLSPLSGGHFTHVYEYCRDGQPHILRITPPNPDVDVQSTRAMLEWLAFLADHAGPVARPVRSEAGNLIEQVTCDGQAYIITSFEKAPGVLAEGMQPEDWSDDLFQALGQALGQCHRAAERYVPARAEFERPDWEASASCFNPSEALEGADPLLLAKRAGVLASLQALPKDRASYGLAHLDLHFGNFFVDLTHQQIVLFDFDDCGYGWYVMDIAMLLLDVLVVYNGLERETFGERFLTNLLKGYHAQKPISLFWVHQLPRFMKLLEIGLTLMLYRSYDPATSDEWVNKFMDGRRERVEADMPYVALDFEAVYRQAVHRRASV